MKAPGQVQVTPLSGTTTLVYRWAQSGTPLQVGLLELGSLSTVFGCLSLAPDICSSSAGQWWSLARHFRLTAALSASTARRLLSVHRDQRFLSPGRPFSAGCRVALERSVPFRGS